MSRAGGTKKKQLFDDDEEEDASLKEKGLKLNKSYAEKYEVVKRKQELQQLQQKYGKELSDSDEESEEDDEAKDLTEKKESAFADVLLKLRTRDVSLLDHNKKFFAALDETSSDEDAEEEQRQSKKAKQKKFTLKDEYQRAVVEGDDEAREEVSEDRVRGALRKGLTAEQRNVKKAFLQAADEGADDDFAITKKDVQEAGMEKKSTTGDQLKKKMEAALLTEIDKTSTDEKFLADFFLNDRWKRGEEEDDLAGYTRDQVEADEDDECFFDEAEQWEQEYQQRKYRHEEGEDALQVATFPRQAEEGLLRRKDTSRKEARERKKEREREVADRATEELKRLKHLKMKEIEDQRKLVKEIAGFEDEARIAAMFSKKDLEEDFDPEKFDKLMSRMFGEEYYGQEDAEVHGEDSDSEGGLEDELALLDATDVTHAPNNNDEDEGEDEMPPAEGEAPVEEPVEEEIEEEEEDKPEGDDFDFLYPTKTIEKSIKRKTKRGQAEQAQQQVFRASDGRTRGEIQEDIDKKMEEYWRLHYNVAGGMPSRFKYREVPNENFGITDEEVLTVDDRTLNMRAPMNCYAAYLTTDENRKDRYKSLHRAKALRTLPADRKSRRYKADSIAIDANVENGEELAAAAEGAARRLKEAVAKSEGQRAEGDSRPAKRQRFEQPREQQSHRGGGGGGFAPRGRGHGRGGGGQKTQQQHSYGRGQGRGGHERGRGRGRGTHRGGAANRRY